MSYIDIDPHRGDYMQANRRMMRRDLNMAPPANQRPLRMNVEGEQSDYRGQCGSCFGGSSAKPRNPKASLSFTTGEVLGLALIGGLLIFGLKKA